MPRTFHVDPAGTAGDGLTPERPLTNLGAVNGLALQPGDKVLFKAGSQFSGTTDWNGLLQIRARGTAEAPITYGSYGSGAAPSFANASRQWAVAIAVNGAAHVHVSGLAVVQGFEAGFRFDESSSDCVVSACDVFNCGQGLLVRGARHTIRNNSIHDLVMVVNTNDGPPPGRDDDYGANALLLTGDGHVVSHNKIWNCRAQSFDYGSDGGGIEFWAGVSNARIHDNIIRDTNGCFECGGFPADLSNVEIYNNLAINNGCFIVFHNVPGTRFGGTLRNVRVHHNTVVDNFKGAGSLSSIYLDSANCSRSELDFYRNIVSINDGDSIFSAHGDYHRENIFEMRSPATHLYNNWRMDLNPGESFGRPAFKNPGNGDYSIQPGGVGDGYGVVTLPPSPAPTPTPAPTPAPEPVPVPVLPKPTVQMGRPKVAGKNVRPRRGSKRTFSQLFSVTDPDGLADVKQYKFVSWWNGSGHFTHNGVKVPTATYLIVPADQLKSVAYVAAGGKDVIQCDAADSVGWSWAWATTNVTPI